MEFTIFHLLFVFVVGQGLLGLLVLFLASRGTGLVLDLFETLDQNLAGAIKKLLEEGGAGGFEPPNPIQAAIAQMLMNKMSENIPQRDPTGQFVKKLE